MIVKMKLISLTGPVSDLDRVVDQYLSKYEIQLENALTRLSDMKNLEPFHDKNPYRDPLTKIREYAGLMGDGAKNLPPYSVSVEEAEELIQKLDASLGSLEEQKKAASKKIRDMEERIERIEPYADFPADAALIFKYKFVDSRVGRFPKDYYEKFKNYVYENFDTIFYPCKTNDQFVYGIYFTPTAETRKIDAVYSSMHFERITIPQEDIGKAADVLARLHKELDDTKRELERIDSEMKENLAEYGPRLIAAEDKLEHLADNFDVRKMAAVMHSKNSSYYIIYGWMGEKDAAALQKEIEGDARTVCLIEDTDNDPDLKPPTKLKNPKIFKPYEMYVRMYGLPDYHEIDPTIFIAITYSFIFGAMYGDLGQGLCLFIGGLLLYKFKHMDLAGIISCAGIFSSFFGIMFGSFFGFEDTVIRHVWLKPKTDKITLPGIGSINTVLVCAVVFGMFLILATMILNIINAKKMGDKEKLCFGTNSIAGFIFYVGVVIAVFTAFGAGNMKIGAVFVIIFFVIPLVLMFCKEPLTNKMMKKSPAIEGGVGMFIVQNFFEMFETLLSFFSNTISYVRIGAFAVSHAAMMEVVLMLSGAEKGSINWGGIVLGNAFVMGMEGLIVGIQVLRLEYYEMFSRFYTGDGREFRPFFKVKKKA
ncbi:MAG: V-type ATPase 116kDa subunit family protein [Lachnospiraceae bacterium]|nr:V-type ATPase 116kDa subunit family protein [Lachnospiraceae bacterium]